MVAFTVICRKPKNSAAKATLSVEGIVTPGDLGKLRELCLDTFKHVDHLELNIERIGRYDFAFNIFVCLLRRTAPFLSKSLTVLGEQEKHLICVYESALEFKANRCSFSCGGTHCSWGNLITRTAFNEQEPDPKAGRPENGSGVDLLLYHCHQSFGSQRRDL